MHACLWRGDEWLLSECVLECVLVSFWVCTCACTFVSVHVLDRRRYRKLMYSQYTHACLCPCLHLCVSMCALCCWGASFCVSFCGNLPLHFFHDVTPWLSVKFAAKIYRLRGHAMVLINHAFLHANATTWMKHKSQRLLWSSILCD